MTNQQLKAHCEDVIANPQDHPDWVVDMARVALASLEAEPVAWVTMQPSLDEDERTVLTKKDLAERFSKKCYDLTPLYPTAPAPELKAIDFEEDEAALEKGVSALIDCLEDCGDAEQGLRLALRAMTGVE